MDLMVYPIGVYLVQIEIAINSNESWITALRTKNDDIKDYTHS